MAKSRDSAHYLNNALAKIQETFRSLAIFRRIKTLAIYNYILASELDALKSGLRNPILGPFDSHRRTVESSMHAVPALYELCPDTPIERPYADEVLLREARELFDFAHKYEQVLYASGLASRGQFRIFVSRVDPRITFAYSSGEADRLDTRKRALETQRMESSKSNENTAEALARLIQAVAAQTTAKRRDSCAYHYNDELIEAAARYGQLKFTMTNRLDVPIDARVGEIMFVDLAKLWGALLAICDVHLAAHVIGDKGALADLAINTVVMCKPKAEFVELLARISGLTARVVDTIVQWYTYDARISNGVPILQPFLPLHRNALCLPSSFINGNSFERNFRKLMYYHPSLIRSAKAVEKRLEPTALESLSKLFPAAQYKVRPNVKIPGITDVDLLVFDFRSKHALAVQHKWLIAPDTLKESSANDERLMNGVSQATRSTEYLNSNHSFVREKLELSEHQEIRTILGVVISRGLEGTGFLGSTAAPVLDESSFEMLMAKAKDLGQLWDLLTSRPDHGAAAERSVEVRTRLWLCGYEFVFPGLAVAVEPAK